jgi:hypothetical protein
LIKTTNLLHLESLDLGSADISLAFVCLELSENLNMHKVEQLQMKVL